MNFVVERPERHTRRPPGNVAHRAAGEDGMESLCGQIANGIPTDDEHAALLSPCVTCESLVP